MGTSYVTVAGQTSAFDDGDLMVAVQFTINALPTDEQSRRLALLLQRALDEFGPGVVDIPLHEVAGDPQLNSRLLHSWTVVERAMAEFGDLVPLDVVKSECRRLRGISFKSPYPTRRIVSTIASMRSLISGSFFETESG